ncbi:MAG: hypothetical protein AAGC95_17020, partial [Pseudomonadota bacterium]
SAPYGFALLSGLLALYAAIQLERARMVHDAPFFTGMPVDGFLSVLIAVWAFFGSIFKALLVGILALFTFSVKNSGEIIFVYGLFFITLLIGLVAARRLIARYGPIAARWAYFRLTILLGVVYSTGMYLFTKLGFVDSFRVRETVSAIFGNPNTFDKAVNALDNARRTYDHGINVIVEKFFATIPGGAAIGALFQILFSSYVSQGFVISALVFVIASTGARQAD